VIPVDIKEVQKKLLSYKETVDKLQEYFIKIEEDPTNDQFDYVSTKIEEFGQNLKEICKTAFTQDEEKDNDPFFWIEYYDEPGASFQKQRRNEINYLKDKIDAVQSFVGKKIEKTSLFVQEVISEKDKGDSKIPHPSVHIENVEKLVTGNEINIHKSQIFCIILKKK
jgi:hypothetical protein